LSDVGTSPGLCSLPVFVKKNPKQSIGGSLLRIRPGQIFKILICTKACSCMVDPAALQPSCHTNRKKGICPLDLGLSFQSNLWLPGVHGHFSEQARQRAEGQMQSLGIGSQAWGHSLAFQLTSCLCSYIWKRWAHALCRFEFVLASTPGRLLAGRRHSISNSMHE